jgi:hypothetical protein
MLSFAPTPTMMFRRYMRAVLACVLLAFILFGCERTVTVKKQMTWECAPEEYKQGYGARSDEYVRFRYVENPSCFEVESARNLCAELRSAGKPAVEIEFEVWGGPTPFSRGPGYNIAAIDGRAFADVGGWGNNGSNNFTGECPIGKVMRNLKSVLPTR